MARGDGRIYRHPESEFFWCAYYLRGKQYRQSTGETNEKKAQNFLRRKLKEVGADQIGAKAFIAPQQEKVTVNEILDDYVNHYRRGGKRSIPREPDSSMTGHLKRVRDFLGDRKAMLIGTAEIDSFIAHLQSEGKANATINRSLEMLRAAYRYAVGQNPPKLLRAITIRKLDESTNVRKGKFSPQEAEAVAENVPDHLSDVCRFGYVTGCRAGEILGLRWSFLENDAIVVPATLTKNRREHNIALTPELEEIIDRRKARMVADCPYIFHNDGKQILDYHHAWASTCVSLGLGQYYCRECRDADGKRTVELDANKVCSRCGQHWVEPIYRGRIFHDFRRSAAHEMWKSGSSEQDCMETTGHKTPSMFRRYADLFSKDEKLARHREVQQRRNEWRRAQASVIPMPKTTAVQ
jgi:integrase